jgi:hypothetical protein
MLDFPDGHFDLVFSVHALEHLPSDIFVPALKEMSRVTARNGLQFHLMPIIGEPPYIGERSEMIRLLQKDPTHNILEDLSWWINQWSKFGWEDTGLSAIFSDDTESFELTNCQFLLQKIENTFTKTSALAKWNREQSAEIFSRRTRNEVISSNTRSLRSLNFGAANVWNDSVWTLQTPTDLTNSTLVFMIENSTSQTLDFRVALLDRHEAKLGHIEEWRRFPPGVSIYTAAVRNMALKGEVFDTSAVMKILFGGTCADASLKISLMTPKLPFQP